MKPKLKSALISGLFIAPGLALAACDNIQWPHVYGADEVPQSVRDQPRIVTSPPPLPADTTYPPLGNVPAKPNDFTPAADIVHQKEQMENDRADGQALKEQVQTPDDAQEPQD